MFDFTVLHRTVLGQDISKQSTKFRRVPFTLAQFIKQLAPGFVGTDRECAIERAARGDDAQILVQHDERLAHGVDDRMCERRCVMAVDEVLAEHNGSPLRELAASTLLEHGPPATHYVRNIHSRTGFTNRRDKLRAVPRPRPFKIEQPA